MDGIQKQIISVGSRWHSTADRCQTASQRSQRGHHVPVLQQERYLWVPQEPSIGKSNFSITHNPYSTIWCHMKCAPKIFWRTYFKESGICWSWNKLSSYRCRNSMSCRWRSFMGNLSRCLAWKNFSHKNFQKEDNAIGSICSISPTPFTHKKSKHF